MEKRVSDYELLLEINNAVNRIETKYDKRFESIEENISALQEFKNRTMGMFALLSVFVGVAVSWVWNKLTES